MKVCFFHPRLLLLLLCVPLSLLLELATLTCCPRATLAISKRVCVAVQLLLLLLDEQAAVASSMLISDELLAAVQTAPPEMWPLLLMATLQI